MRIASIASIATCAFLGGAVFAHPGNGIVALSATAVLTGDALHNGIWRFEKGKAPVKLTGDQRFHCHWVTKGLDGRFYAETLSERNGAWTDSVFRLDSNGANPSEIAHGNEGAFGVFAVGRSGEIVHQTRSSISAWLSGRNTPFRSSGLVASGSPALGAVNAFAWAPNDVLYLADGPHIRRIGSDGVVRLVTRIDEKSTHPLYAGQNGSIRIWGLAVSASGNLFVAIPSMGATMRIDKEGRRRIVARGSDGWQATGVAVYGETIFLLESKTQGNRNFGPRVRSIMPDGSSVILGTAS